MHLATYRDRQQPLQRAERNPENKDQRAGAMARMPKECVLALAQTLKRCLVVASPVSFGTFGGLATVHQVGVATTPTTQSSPDASQSAFQPPSSAFGRNDFFNQQRGDNFGSRNTSPTPITGSGVS